MQEEKKENINAKDLRRFADLVEELDLKYMFGTFYYRCDTPEEFRRVIKSLGAFEKEADVTDLQVSKRYAFGNFKPYVSKQQTCKPIITGERTIAAQPERTIPAQPERKELVYGWECPESFLSPEKEDNIEAEKNK